MKKIPINIEGYDLALREQSDRLIEGSKEYKRANEVMKVFNEERNKGIEWLRNKKMQVLNLRQNLAQNPPTFKRALNDLSWGQKIGSAIYLFASKSGDPKRYLDEQVAKKLHDLKVEHQAKKGFLDQADNMFTQFYNIEKDDFKAEMDVQNALRENIKSQIKIAQDRTTNQKQLMNLQGYVTTLDNEIAKNNNAIEQSDSDNLSERITKGFDMSMKAFDSGIKQIKESGGGDIKYSDVKSFYGKDTVMVGDTRFFTGENTKKVKEAEDGAVAAIKDTIPGLRFRVNRLKKLMGISKALPASLAAIPGKTGQKARRDFQTLNKTMIQLMLKDRIPFTGGGNMSYQELEFLKLFYNVHDKTKNWLLKDTREINHILTNVYKGDYETLFKIIEKDRFQKYLRTLDTNSEDFKKLSFSDQFKRAAQGIGLINKKGQASSKYNDKLLSDMWKNYMRNRTRAL